MQPAHLASTVVLLRETNSTPSFDVLMLRRNATGGFGGMWVFPGGRVDPDDGFGEAAFVAAAVREVREEAGLDLNSDDLTPFSFWSPRGSGKRFDTKFFVALAPDADVTVDGAEVEEYVWSTPARLLDAHAGGTLDLVPPTWRTLAWLATHATPADVFAAAQRDGVVAFTGRVVTDAHGGRVVLWRGDAAYESDTLDVAGARHRLHMGSLPWRLERVSAEGIEIPA
jgi:8-oxo-dGTP pyrophosphatase MutT (NUDIX family)